MTYDRPVAMPPPGAEPPQQSQTADSSAIALRLQILSTEHWSLLASRALAWNEVFSRASMFLSTIAGAIVALALVAQASEFGRNFRLFALAILPVVLFVGVGTLVRITASQYHDALCVVGMNRIRAKYLELAPDLEPLFVMGRHDDERGVMKTMAIDFQQSPVALMISATPLMVATLDSILLGAIVALLVIELGASTVVGLVFGAAAFLIGSALHVWWARRMIHRVETAWEPLYPTPAEIP
jgi:hypothetical protein